MTETSLRAVKLGFLSHGREICNVHPDGILYNFKEVIYIRVCVHVCVYTHKHACTHTDTHTHTHTHTERQLRDRLLISNVNHAAGG